MADLNALVVFARVAEAGSFSEAARRLRMPVSTVSRRVAELERQLGVRLLVRTTRQLRLTDIGADIVRHARHGAELNDAVEDIISDRRAVVAGPLRLSAPPSLSEALLVPIVLAFQAEHPNVRVSVFITQRMADPVADGIDLMLRVDGLKDSSLVARRLLRYRHGLVASPAYLGRAGTPRHPNDLAAHRLIAFAADLAGAQWHFADSGGGPGIAIPLAPHLAMNDYAGIAQAALDGGGIADLPPMVGADWLRQGRLVPVLPGWRLPLRDLSLVQPGNRHPPRPVRAFQDFAARLAPRLFAAPE